MHLCSLVVESRTQSHYYHNSTTKPHSNPVFLIVLKAISLHFAEMEAFIIISTKYTGVKSMRLK